MSGTGHSEPASGGPASGEPGSGSGVIRHQPIADFSHLSSPEELAAVTRIEHVAMVIVPESLAAAYAKIPRERVAATVYVPGGARIRVHTGSLTLGGHGLGAEADVLVVVGMLIITSPVTGDVPRQISVVGSVLAPRGSEHVLGPALSGGAGSVTYYRYAEGQDLKVLTGQVKLSGAMLANPAGQPGDVLIAAGQAVVTGEVGDVGYAQVVVAGQLVAPAAARDLIEPRLHLQGQAVWYRGGGGEPKIIFDDTRLGPDFFRLLDRPVSLVVLGDLVIEPGVTEAMVREKVSEIAVLGDVTAPAEVVPAVQVLATDVLGTIRARDGQGS